MLSLLSNWNLISQWVFQRTISFISFVCRTAIFLQEQEEWDSNLNDNTQNKQLQDLWGFMVGQRQHIFFFKPFRNMSKDVIFIFKYTWLLGFLSWLLRTVHLEPKDMNLEKCIALETKRLIRWQYIIQFDPNCKFLLYYNRQASVCASFWKSGLSL